MDEVESFSIKSLISRKIKKIFLYGFKEIHKYFVTKTRNQNPKHAWSFLTRETLHAFLYNSKYLFLDTQYLQKSLTLVILIRDALTWCFSVILSLSQKFNLWMSSSLFLKYIYIIIYLMYRTSVLLVTGSATDPQKVFLLCSSSVFPSNI